MHQSDNQFTARMRGGCRHEQEPFIPKEDAGQEALQEFWEWIDSMPIADAEMALRGINAYLEDLQMERELEQGWHRIVEDVE